MALSFFRPKEIKKSVLLSQQQKSLEVSQYGMAVNGEDWSQGYIKQENSEDYNLKEEDIDNNYNEEALMVEPPVEVKIKKKRGKNYDNTEYHLLLMEILRNFNILETKKSDAATWDLKKNTWTDISLVFKVHGYDRTPESLKEKYESTKKDLKRKAANMKQKRKTGRDIPEVFITVEKRLYDLLKHRNDPDHDTSTSELETISEETKRRDLDIDSLNRTDWMISQNSVPDWSMAEEPTVFLEEPTMNLVEPNGSSEEPSPNPMEPNVSLVESSVNLEGNEGEKMDGSEIVCPVRKRPRLYALKKKEAEKIGRKAEYRSELLELQKETALLEQKRISSLIDYEKESHQLEKESQELEIAEVKERLRFEKETHELKMAQAREKFQFEKEEHELRIAQAREMHAINLAKARSFSHLAPMYNDR